MVNIMNIDAKLWGFTLLVMVLFGGLAVISWFGPSVRPGESTYSEPYMGGSDIDKIIAAKSIVINSANYPDTLDFHDMKTRVNGNRVSLTFTAKNGFGVPETYTIDVDAN